MVPTCELMTMMFFLVPSSRQTRRAISSGVAVNGLWACVSGKDRLGELAGRNLLSTQERVEVRDDDLRSADGIAHIGRNDIPPAVVVLGIARQQHAQTITNGDARPDDEERIGKPGILGIVRLVEDMPCDQKRHYGRLPSAGSHLESHAVELRVVILRDLPQAVLNPSVVVLVRDLSQVDDRLDGLKLAEEEPLVAVVSGPVLKQ